VFESVVAVVFQSAFCSEMNQYKKNYFLKKLFFTLAHQNDLKTLKKNNFQNLMKSK
jgi:hypothetical protein